MPSEVVAITFTRKAASELRNRIRKRLNNTDINLYSITDGDVEMLLSRLEDAPISTIDAFLFLSLIDYEIRICVHLKHKIFWVLN